MQEEIGNAQRALDSAEMNIAKNEIELQPLTEMYQKMVQEKEESFVKQLVAKHDVRSSVESDGATSKTRSHLMLAKISEDPIGE